MTGKNHIADEDHDLVSSCKKGDTGAFEALVVKYQKKMFNVAYRMLGDYDDASEVAQDAFVAAFKNIARFREKSKFSTWLYTIVLNMSRNRLGHRKALRSHESASIDDPILTEEGQIRVEVAAPDPSPLQRLEQKDIQQKVQGCINSLDPEAKEAVILRDIQGFSYEEIREMLNIPEGTVKSRLFRAREALADCLKRVIGEL